MAKLELVKVEPEANKAERYETERMRRYEQDAYALRNIREAGRRASMKLLHMLENEAEWEGLAPRVRMQVIELALTRAYGRVETVTAEEKAASAGTEVVGALPSHLRALAASLVLPELAKAGRAKE
jgi:hypothetical protein